MTAMDTSFWTLFNPDISFGRTTKKYYGKYLYKLLVYAPAGRLIEKEGTNIPEALKNRRELAELRINWGTSWWSRGAKALDADPVFLEVLGHLKHNCNKVRFRIEEPNVSIYAETEDALKDIAITLDSSQHKYIIGVSGPESEEAIQHLNSGAIIRRKSNDYRYKVILKDGRYNVDTKHSILNYLNNTGETLITAGCQDQLFRDFTYVWNVFFYTNDKDVIHFIELIAPGSIANIHELVVLDNK